MPVIHRPNSDAQRLRALGVAKAKADATDPVNLAFSAETLTQLDAALPQFAQELQERGAALSAQATATASANPARKTLNMYIRHFIAVYNLGVDRGKYTAANRAFYQLPVDYHSLPKLGTDEENLIWGYRITNGDAARVTAGGAPMENPTASEVQTALTDLQAAIAAQSPAKDAYDKEQEDVENMRAEVDDLIADIWDEVLFTFRKDTAPSMRRKAREYGIVYRQSKGEAPTPEEFSITGVVTAFSADTTGTPMVDVLVTVVDTDTTALTNEVGEYLMPLLPPGAYTLRFSKAGYTSTDVPATVVEGEITELDAQLMPEV